MRQGEESPGYQQLVSAAGRVHSVPVAVCTQKEVWSHYALSSDTIALFRKVFHHREPSVSTINGMLPVSGGRALRTAGDPHEESREWVVGLQLDLP